MCVCVCPRKPQHSPCLSGNLTLSVYLSGDESMEQKIFVASHWNVALAVSNRRSRLPLENVPIKRWHLWKIPLKARKQPWTYHQNTARPLTFRMAFHEKVIDVCKQTVRAVELWLTWSTPTTRTTTLTFAHRIYSRGDSRTCVCVCAVHKDTVAAAASPGREASIRNAPCSEIQLESDPR